MHAFPQTEATDIDSVADALDSGLVHWVKGETVEALRCLRAATTAACVAGIDQRALHLARAAADLSPEQAPEPIEESKVRRSQSAEPRRLPEPPAAPKKFTGSPDADAPTTSKAGSARSATNSSAPSHPPSQAAPKNSTGSSDAGAPTTSKAGSSRAATNGSGPSDPPRQGTPSVPASAKSTSPSSFARPSSTKAANNGAGSARSVIAPPGNGATSKPPVAASNSSLPKSGSSTEHEPLTTASAAMDSAGPSSAASNAASSSKVPPHSVQPTPSAETRTATRPNGHDLRLASVRVRIDRIDADGTICLRQLDLAATASGEDNAMLVLNQSLWQELKRGS